MWHYTPETKAFARSNRRQRKCTRQEGILWHCYLKKCPVRFFRQYRINEYIIDFYAPTIKLAIEIDGGQHYEEKSLYYDKIRSENLSSLGITVLRFTNPDIDKNLRRTVEQIVCKIEEMTGEKLY